MSSRTLVVVGLVHRGGRLLIAQRGEPSGYAGYWEFPGGKKETGESDSQAITRELVEELAIEVEVGALVWTTTARGLHLRFLACQYRGGSRPRPIACAQFRWVRIDELASYRFPPADDSILDALARGAVRHVIPPGNRVLI